MPVYKAHDTIKSTLASIAMQRLAEFKCYLVVDGEEHGSYDYLKWAFEELLDFEILYMKDNGGPGVARQYGIDHSQEPYITFIDADDTYLSSLALYYQLKPIKNDMKIALVSCDFLEEKQNHEIVARTNDMVWMHGKMYKREFLDKYEIRFNDTRANEDVGFNTQCQCYANIDEQIYLSKDNTYLWQWRDNSTVRADNSSYAYNESIEGYVLNKIYAFETVLAKRPNDDSVNFFIASAFEHLFVKYMTAMIKAPKRLNHIKRWSRIYYNKLYSKLPKEWLEKAEPTILYSMGLKKQEQHDEFQKFKKMLVGKKS